MAARRFSWQYLAVVALAALMLPACSTFSAPNKNALAIGSKATLPFLQLGITPPTELDSISKADVFRLRRSAALEHPELLTAPYQPSAGVFGQVKDGLPWWGMQGQFYYGSGTRSIEGPSEESRFIINPYLLVAAEFRGLSIWADGDQMLAWDKTDISDETLNYPGFPLYCEPQDLLWRPVEARAEVTYDVSAYIYAVNRWTLRPVTLSQAEFDLVAYNARDLGLNYLYVAYDASYEISKPDPPRSAISIPQYLHAGGSCGYPGGCNNMSPHVPEIEGIQIEALPAEAVVWLWANKPRSVGQTPDMTFILHFQ